MTNRCKHNWTSPTECPACCAEERDDLRQQLAAETARSKGFREMLQTVFHQSRHASNTHDPLGVCSVCDRVKDMLNESPPPPSPKF